MTAPDLIVITDDALSDDETELGAARILAQVPPGSTALQLRDRRRSARALLALAERLRSLTTRHAAPLIVNDRIDIALAIDADGIHLGGRSIEMGDARRLLGSGAFLSVAAHAVADVEAASHAGATAVLVAPIFATPGKGSARGTALLAEVRARAGDVLVYALGGIDPSRVVECMRAGAYGVAAIRSVWSREGGVVAARTMVDQVRASRR